MLIAEWEGPVLRVTLNRPEVRNAINDEVISRLKVIFEGEARTARAVVISGIGKGFCAGGDLDWMKRTAGYTHEANVADALELAGLFEAILACPAVVIAQVHGAAFGGGAGLVCMADVAVASIEATFAFSEVKLGLVPATISPFVIQKIGAGHARALFTTGEPFDAERALRIGLIHEVVEQQTLADAVDRKLVHILKSGPEAVRVSKWLSQQAPMDRAKTASLLAEARAGEEGKEGVAAFLEKRPAGFVIAR